MGHSYDTVRVKLSYFVMVLLFVGASISPAWTAEKGPIKIGYMSPTTGNFAQFGQDMGDAFKMFLEERNYTVAGRKIEVISEDEGTPAQAVTKARKLINSDNIHLMAGVWFTPSTYAVAPVVEKAGVPFVVTTSGGDDLTQRKRSETLIRLTYTGCQLGHAFGHYAYHQLGWRTAVVLGSDFAFPHEFVGAFQEVFEDQGGKIIQKIWAPSNAMDFNPYVENLNPKADGLVDGIFGSMSVRFLRALQSSGKYKGKIVTGVAAADETLLPALGDLALGVYSTSNWSAALDTPENKKFVNKVHQVLKREASVTMSSNYTGADWIVRAIQAVNGDVEDKGKLMKALKSIEIPDSLRGPIKLDKYNHNIQNIYVRRIERKADVAPAKRAPGTFQETQNTVVYTYPAVSQFWTYDPEKYMAKPVYSRDIPPCKYCQ